MKIGIIGGGATGLSAAFELSKCGHSVTVFESSNEAGGLVGALPVGSRKLERFYHHIFTSDTDLVDLIEELGLSSLLKWYEPRNSIFINNCIYPFTSPLDLLRFKELPFINRILMGSLVYRAKFVKDWAKLDNITARDWIIEKAGKSVYEKVWGPLLQSKFDVDADSISATWIWNKFKLRGSTRAKNNVSKELLGYMDGSFTCIYEELVKKITEKGNQVLLSAKVTGLQQKADGTFDVFSSGSSYNFDRVILTSPPSTLMEMGLTLPSEYTERLKKIRYKANICMILEMSEKLSPYYWNTVADRSYPFVAVVEHTNLIPPETYGKHIVYLSRYLDEKDDLYGASDDRISQLFISNLKRMFPLMKESEIIRTHVSRARFTQPVVFTGYSEILPKFETPVKNLYMAGMPQIYPEDRGQNYSVRIGRQVAAVIKKEE